MVDSDEKLIERVRFVHERIGTDAIAEQFIAGRELYVSVLGSERLESCLCPRAWRSFAVVSLDRGPDLGVCVGAPSMARSFW